MNMSAAGVGSLGADCSAQASLARAGCLPGPAKCVALQWGSPLALPTSSSLKLPRDSPSGYFGRIRIQSGGRRSASPAVHMVSLNYCPMSRLPQNCFSAVHDHDKYIPFWHVISMFSNAACTAQNVAGVALACV